MHIIKTQKYVFARNAAFLLYCLLHGRNSGSLLPSQNAENLSIKKYFCLFVA